MENGTIYRRHAETPLLEALADSPAVLIHGPRQCGKNTLAVAGIEVKASATVSPADFRGLRKLKRTAGKRFAAGTVLYDGEITAGFGDGMFAVPLRVLFEG